MNPADRMPDLFEPTPRAATQARWAEPRGSAYDLDAAYSAKASRQAGSSWKQWLLVAVLLALANAWLWLSYTESGRIFGLSNEQAPQSTVEGKKIMPVGLPVSSKTATGNPPPAAVLPNTASEKTVCRVWEFYSNSDVKKADNRLAEQAWSGYVAELADEPFTYMVFVGPFDTRSELDAKLKVLEKMKLKDYSALPSAMISLGVLSSQAAADALKTTLSKRGLMGVQTSERSGSTQRTRYRFDALKPDSLNELNLLAANLGSLKACP